MGAAGTSLPAARGRVAGRKVPAGAKGGAVVRGRRSSRGVRVRAAGDGLFGAASAVNTQEIAAKITEIKETELELSRGIWRAVDAATAAATDAVAPLAGMDLTRGLRAAFDGALQAVPEPIRERVSALIDMVMANEELVRTVSSVPDIVWVLAIVATVGSKALGGGSSATAGMDEWAALAAAEGDEEPIQLQNYDPDAIYAHFKKRPLVLLKRGLRSGSLLGGFGFSLWLDRKMLGEDPPEKKKAAVDAKRAIQLRDLLISLGPTYVKLGQVLSSRQDLLPAPYIKELRTLQDSVPPFDDNLAKRILAAELGPAGARNLSLGAAPIASASLGQVYRGTLKKPDGTTEEVAVKVQRPGALVAISLDVGIIRSFAEPWRKFKGLNTDLESLVDEWGIRFINELDYGQEAAAGEQFRLAMESRPDLAGVVTTAPVMPSASTRRVLTTGWINGQRLDTSEEGDVPRLCAVALASYLAMLLDIGTLHADPHPGNLFRTDDGKLCILDWGLVTPVSKDLRTAILSFIAHLVSKDFEAVPGDLDAMGFIPTGKREAMEDLGVASAIGLLFSALAKGGGAEGFRAELGLPDEDKIKEIRKELKGVKGHEGQAGEVPRGFGRRGLEGCAAHPRPRGNPGEVRQHLPDPVLLWLHPPFLLGARGYRAGVGQELLHRQRVLPLRRQEAPHRRHPGDSKGARAAPLRQERAQGSALREARQATRQRVRQLLVHHQRQGVP
jgi:predicted unusual protein kinase regulating ubiquinone biosynthesis (AarF/ABC1/UbiB family)